MKTLFFFLVILLVDQSFSQLPTNGMIFNGSSNFYEIPDNSDTDLSGSFTLEAWINPCDTTGTKMIFGKQWCSGNNYSYSLSIFNGKLRWFKSVSGSCTGSISDYQSNARIIRNNIWQHVAVVHTPTSISLYRNGVLVAGSLIAGTYNGNFKNSTQPLRIGAYRHLSGGFSLFFNGRMDEIRVWQSIRNSTQIFSNYNIPLLGNEPGLRIYHNMENVTGALITNSATSTGTTNDGNAVSWLPKIVPNKTSYPFPFFLGNDTTICDSVSFALNISNSYDSYLWNDGSTLNTKNITSSGTYIAFGYQDYCFTSDTVNIVIDCDTLVDPIPLVEKCESYFLMPNVFTPNGDQINDLFKPIQDSCYDLKRFIIVNRWGNVVFESTTKVQWNGMAQNGKSVKEGVYFWIIEYSNQRYKSNYEHGSVSLFK